MTVTDDNHAFTLRVARQRGRLGYTFATAEELATPGYDEAYRLGQQESLIAEADGLEGHARRQREIAAGPFRES